MADVYEMVQNEIMKELEAGNVPWHRPWTCSIPANLKSRREYRGINPFLLDLVAARSGYSSQWWLTFNQAKVMSGYKKVGRKYIWSGDGDDPGYGVNKGEHGTSIIFWRFLERPKRDDGGSIVFGTDGKATLERFPLLRYYKVFHVEQCTLPDGLVPMVDDGVPIMPVDKADVMLNEFVKREDIYFEHGGSRCAYSPTLDHIMMPTADHFETIEDYYASAFHEAGHSTGHPKRLNRFEVASLPSREECSKEELVAELCASMILGQCGILKRKQVVNAAAYIRAWTKALDDDSHLIVNAAAQAQRAADRIKNVKWEDRDDD